MSTESQRWDASEQISHLHDDERIPRVADVAKGKPHIKEFEPKPEEKK